MRPGWKAEILSIRRIGAEVFLRVYKIDGTAATSSLVFDLPTGFGTYGLGLVLVIGGAPVTVNGARTATLSPGSIYYGGAVHFGSPFISTEAWPTELPGVAG